MRRIFGVAKEKGPAPTVDEATERINKRGDTIDEKIRKVDAELAKYKDQLKKTRPGPAQENIKRKAMGLLRQKKMFEGQRDQLYNQTYNLEQISFATSGMKDAQETMKAMKAAGKDMKQQMKTMKISDIDRMQDDWMDHMDDFNDIQESLGRSYGVPDDIDEEDLMGELDALELEMGEGESSSMPSYLTPEPEPEMAPLPSAPSSIPHAATASAQSSGAQQHEDAYGMPAAPSGMRS